MLFALGAAPANAQSTAQIPLQFDFLDPGARSLGLGSAFVAVADDATAAFTNPAGLTSLIKPEFSAELRYRRLETPYLAGGRISGTVTNIGADTIAGPLYVDSIDSASLPYYLSFVYPAGRWRLAGYRHELLNQENSFASAGAFEQVIFAGNPTNAARDNALEGTRDLQIENYGGTVAYRINSALSVGAGVSIYHLDLTSNFARYGFVGNVFGPVDHSSVGSTASQTGSSTQAGVNAGLLWMVAPKVHVGAVFRQGVSLAFTQTDVVPDRPTLTRTGDFRSPNVFGAGIRVQPRDDWSFSVDYDRIQYSRVKQDFIDFQAISTGTQDQLSIEDANEVHAGAEYVLTKVAHHPGIRFGVWYDPDHAVTYLSDGSNSQIDVRLKATLPGGKSLVHYCAGFGMPLSDQFEFNIGTDMSSQRRYFSASVVARFGK
jgi:long-subunit fatty acid transport protein